MEKVPRNMSASLEQKLPIIMSCNCCVLEAHKKMQCTQLCVQNDEKKKLATKDTSARKRNFSDGRDVEEES